MDILDDMGVSKLFENKSELLMPTLKLIIRIKVLIHKLALT